MATEKLTNESAQAWTKIGHETQTNWAVERQIQRIWITKDELIVKVMLNRGQVDRSEGEGPSDGDVSHR